MSYREELYFLEQSHPQNKANLSANLSSEGVKDFFQTAIIRTLNIPGDASNELSKNDYTIDIIQDLNQILSISEKMAKKTTLEFLKNIHGIEILTHFDKNFETIELIMLPGISIRFSIFPGSNIVNKGIELNLNLDDLQNVHKRMGTAISEIW